MYILQMQNEVFSTNEAKITIMLPSTINYIKNEFVSLKFQQLSPHFGFSRLQRA